VKIPISREHLISAFGLPEISADGAADIDAWVKVEEGMRRLIQK